MSWTIGVTAAARSRIVSRTALLAAVMTLASVTSEAAHHKAHTAAPASTDTTSVNCSPTPDQSSIGIRALQTELMVAGLKCSAEQWNNFTEKFKSTIKADADRMQHLFSKVYGKSGASKMNAFVTQLANDASERSNQSGEADYCKQEDTLFQKILVLTGKDLERFSVHRPLAVPAPVSLCAPMPDTAIMQSAMAGATPATAVAATNTTSKSAIVGAKSTPAAQSALAVTTPIASGAATTTH